MRSPLTAAPLALAKPPSIVMNSRVASPRSSTRLSLVAQFTPMSHVNEPRCTGRTSSATSQPRLRSVAAFCSCCANPVDGASGARRIASSVRAL